jgi:hypothetical protein
VTPAECYIEDKEIEMPAKRRLPTPADSNDDKGRFWQPPEKRNVVSEAGKKWQEENAEAAKAWAEWVEKKGVPLRPLF